MKRLMTALLAAALLLGLCVPAAAAGAAAYSEELVTYIKTEEGFRDKPYNDGTGWYVGYGCACDPGDYPDGIGEEAADALLRERMDQCAEAVQSFLSHGGVKVNQGQFDALCAMTYNFGSGWLDAGNRLPSYLLTGIGNYTEQQIASAFAAWCHVGGEASLGLLRRRIIEAKMFLDGDYSGTDAGWRYLLLDAGGGSVTSDVAVYREGEPYIVLPLCEREGFTFGGWRKPDGTLLDPDETVTENLSLLAVWGDTAPVAAEPESRFSDVPAGAWYAPAVERMARQGALGGYEDGTFRPNNSVTWGEALKLVLRTAGFQEQQAKAGEHWAEGYKSFAVERKFLSSGSGGDLGKAMTRDEVADLCAAALDLNTARYVGVDSPFADTSRESVLALYDAEILLGSVEDGARVYKGGTGISRAEVCAVLERMLDYVDRNFAFLGTTRVRIDPSLRRNSYDNSAFRAASGGRVVYEDPSRAVRYGIDVSYYQGDIDWARVAADGIDFAIIRCGYRSYGKGAEVCEDVKFKKNIEGALAAGLDVGVYFFSQALTRREAEEEAAFTLAAIAPYRVTYPVVFDWEQVSVSGSRSRNPDWDSVADCTETFLDSVASAGYKPMAYFNKTQAYLQIDMSRLQAYDGWLAWYHDYMDYAYDFQMWQYGSSGSVAGIAGSVDMDISFVDYGAEAS